MERMEKAGAGFVPPKKWKVNEPGRPPASYKEKLAADVAAVTKTPVGRWMKYPENALQRALADFSETPRETIRKPGAYMTWLVVSRHGGLKPPPGTEGGVRLPPAGEEPNGSHYMMEDVMTAPPNREEAGNGPQREEKEEKTEHSSEF